MDPSAAMDAAQLAQEIEANKAAAKKVPSCSLCRCAYGQALLKCLWIWFHKEVFSLCGFEGCGSKSCRLRAALAFLSMIFL